jgi:redox-sensing transcriptional repressor
VQRLGAYRRVLLRLPSEGRRNLFSHEIAALAGVSASQVRRDLMMIGYEGSPNRGYDAAGLLRSLGEFLDDDDGQKVALAGVGNLGRAVLDYFIGRRPKLVLSAAFDSDPNRVDRVIHGCRCYSVAVMDRVIRDEGITVGIITVPREAAQEIADRMVTAGVHGILNFAPRSLRVPGGVFVEDMDLTTSLEMVAFYARAHGEEREKSGGDADE